MMNIIVRIYKGLKWHTQKSLEQKQSNKSRKNGYNSIKDTAERLGVHPESLGSWVKRLESPKAIKKHKELDTSNEEIKKL